MKKQFSSNLPARDLSRVCAKDKKDIAYMLHDTLNAIEKAAIAKSVADYIIDHLLVEEPMSATDLERLAVDITEDKGITDAGEFADITRLAVNYV